MNWSENGRRLPPLESIPYPQYGSKKRNNGSSGTPQTDQWAHCDAILVHPNNDGYPVIEHDGQTCTFKDPVALMDFLLERPYCVTYSDAYQTHSLLKLFPPSFCQALARQRSSMVPYDTPSQRYWVMLGANESLLVRRGQSWGRLSNFHQLEPDGFDVTLPSLKALAQGFYQFLSDAGISIANPSSPANIAQAYIIQHAGRAFPYLRGGNIPVPHLARAYNTYKGGRMEAFQIGHFDNIHCYDFTAQYLSILANLQHCQEPATHWVESSEYQPSAYYGFVRARISYPESWISPISFRLGNRGLLFPFGSDLVVWLAKPELDLLYREGARVEILEGSWGFAEVDVKPFQDPAHKLFTLREHAGPYAKAIKKLGNSLIGKMGSVYTRKKHDSAGMEQITSPVFNPIYISHITSLARAKIYDTALLLGDCGELACITVDGIITTKSTSLPSDRILGQTRFLSSGAGFIATDNFKDRPGQAMWRPLVEASVTENDFHFRIDTRHGLYLFNLDEPPAELHDLLGRTSTLEWDIPIGSSIRDNPIMTNKDILTSRYQTDTMDLETAMITCRPMPFDIPLMDVIRRGH